jgi:hypothetical protein
MHPAISLQFELLHQGWIMANEASPKEETTPSEINPGPEVLSTYSGCLVRVVWMFLGMLLAFIGLILVVIEASENGGWGGPADIFFAAVVLLTVAARSIDHPALKPSRKRFAAVAIGGTAVLWLLAHAAGLLLK